MNRMLPSQDSNPMDRSGGRSNLTPDHEGHFSRQAIELDRASHRRLAAGGHPIDPVARQMLAEDTRRRFFSRTAQGIGALALSSLLGDTARGADAIGGQSGLPTSRPVPNAVSTFIWWALRRRWKHSTTSRR